jgi:hypothetical protein
MAYSYVIKSVEQAGDKFNVGYAFKKDGVVVIGDTLVIQASSLLSVASDGRDEYIRGRVSDACRKYVVAQDVKVDISELIGVEVSLDAVKYDTKAEIKARETIVDEGTRAEGL